MHFVNLDGTAPPLEEWLGDLLVQVGEDRGTLEGGLLHSLVDGGDGCKPLGKQFEGKALPDEH